MLSSGKLGVISFAIPLKEREMLQRAERQRPRTNHRGAEMKNMKVILLSTCLLLSALPCIGEAADAAAAQAVSLSASAHQFVQDFYDWYIPLAQKDQAGSYYDISVHWRPHAFSKALIQALKEDNVAQKAAKDGPDGLDFDPFLNAQDFCEKNVVGQASINKNTAAVEFYSICSGEPVEKSKQPWVIAELIRTDAGWQFANFKYQNGDLLSTLAGLKRERNKR